MLHDKTAPEPATDPRAPAKSSPPLPARTVARTLAICGLGAAGEVALALGTERSAGFDVMLLLFLVGPPAFVALIAWRRRSHPARSRALLGLATGVCVCGLVALGVLCVRAYTAPQVRPGPDLAPRLVPLAQWVVVLVVWLVIARAEALERRASSTNPSLRS